MAAGGVVGRAEVAVAVDDRQPHRPRLRHPDQRVVDRAVAVGVQPTHDLADDAGALHVAAVGAQAHVVHRVEDPALDRLQPVAGVGQGAGVDDGVGVLEERRLASRRRCRCRGCAPRSRREVVASSAAVPCGHSPRPCRRFRGGHAEPVVECARALTSFVPVVARWFPPGSDRFAGVTGPPTEPGCCRRAPRHWEADVLLRDGRTAHIRPIRARGRRAAGRVLRPGLRRVEVLPVLLPDAEPVRARRRPVHPGRPHRPGRARPAAVRAR